MSNYLLNRLSSHVRTERLPKFQDFILGGHLSHTSRYAGFQCYETKLLVFTGDSDGPVERYRERCGLGVNGDETSDLAV